MLLSNDLCGYCRVYVFLRKLRAKTMKMIKRLLSISLAVLLMLCMGISLVGCANGNIVTPTPDKFYLLLEDTRGKQYELYVEYEPDKTIYSKEKIYYPIEDTDVQIGFYVRGLYVSEDKIFDKRFYQEAREEERSWAYPLNKAGTYDFLKVYYINKFNEKNVFVDHYIVHFKVQVVIY